MSQHNKNPEARANLGRAKPKSRCGGGHDHAGHAHHGHQAAAMVCDPVCGMKVDPASSKHRFEYRGETFHFCSAACKAKFAADPDAYLEKRIPEADVPQGTNEGTIYTCPMHPEIRQVGPGSCPICGM